MTVAAMPCVAATPALLQNLGCRSPGYRASAVDCLTDDERFTADGTADGRARFGWVDAEAFEAKPITRGQITAHQVTGSGGAFYQSMQSLTCTEAR